MSLADAIDILLESFCDTLVNAFCFVMEMIVGDD